MGEERWQTALALFQQMTDESIKKDLVAYNAAMSACGGAWPHALALLQSVPHELGADAVSFGSVISACEKSGEWQAAVLLLQRMFVASVQLTAVALAAALKGECMGSGNGFAGKADTLCSGVELENFQLSYQCLCEATAMEGSAGTLADGAMGDISLRCSHARLQL
eukprot:g24379.t1